MQCVTELYVLLLHCIFKTSSILIASNDHILILIYENKDYLLCLIKY